MKYCPTHAKFSPHCKQNRGFAQNYNLRLAGCLCVRDNRQEKPCRISNPDTPLPVLAR
jgi:hypothetical protein